MYSSPESRLFANWWAGATQSLGEGQLAETEKEEVMLRRVSRERENLLCDVLGSCRIV